MYFDLYNLIANTLYGAVQLTGWQDMFVTCISSACLVFVFAVPFIVLWKVICLIVGR